MGDCSNLDPAHIANRLSLKNSLLPLFFHNALLLLYLTLNLTPLPCRCQGWLREMQFYLYHLLRCLLGYKQAL